jgi:leucyl/phenylalanyl-tRNA--protein transferase
MKDSESPRLVLTPTLVLRAYAAGVFPMAESGDSDEVFWVDPRRRGIIPLDGFHLTRSFRRRLKRRNYEVRIDTAFDQVLEGCADRPETWINGVIRDLYTGLHRMGCGHSIEVWMADRLAGGLYGVRLGGAFFGESMYSRVPDASKIALAYLVARLRAGGFVLLDTQFTTAHLERMGARTVPRARYHRLLDDAVSRPADFYRLAEDASVEAVVQLITQTS